MMRPLLIGLLSLAFSTPVLAQDQSYSDCLVKTGSTWGQPCDKCENYIGYKRDYSGVYHIDLKNVCGDMLEVKVAVQETDGNWHIFPVRTLPGGGTMSAFACKGTGKYLYWVRKVNDTEIVFPTDGQIAATYRGK
jgi:hypothetical protein